MREPGVIDTTYGTQDLAEKLLASFSEIGMNVSALTTADLVAFDELHVMGRQATLDLGRRAKFGQAMHILDIGSGLGGPARTLAETFGCRVMGVDMSQAFVHTAEVLSRLVGLGEKVSFRRGDALSMPFESGTFDGAVMIHLTMNIKDKKALFSEARRVLKENAPLVLWEICKGENDAFVFPVPWAQDSAFSWLATFDAMIDLLKESGFSVSLAEDATHEAAAWVRARLDAGSQKTRASAPRPDLDLILSDFRLKRANISRNLLQGGIRVLRAIATK